MKVSFAQSMNRTQTKAVSGILSICIILHHISQKTAMQLPAGDPAGYVFAPFRNIGYLFVAWFFYTSGYGLKKSLSLRRDYLKDFLIRHLTPVIFSFLVTDVLFQYPRIARHVTAFPANSYSWFVFIILILYVLFHFSEIIIHPQISHDMSCMFSKAVL